ncbi:MAG: hypothetical protein HZA83_00200 [Thaumarchaeota archaeon]|nr:hypothetical protein [Nitrososphaerota archaeon]
MKSKPDNLSQNTQKLLEVLENQYSAEMEEITEYCNLTQKVKDPMFKLYFDNIAFDTSKHASMLGSLISLVKERGDLPLGNVGLSLEELGALREKEKQSRGAYVKCLELAENDAVKLLLKDLILDEDHHFKLVTELLTLCTKSKIRDQPLTCCAQCGYELPKTITINTVPKELENRIKDMLLTIYCPRCDKPYYSILGNGERKDDTSCYS